MCGCGPSVQKRALTPLSSCGAFHSKMPVDNLAWWIPRSTPRTSTSPGRPDVKAPALKKDFVNLDKNKDEELLPQCFPTATLYKAQEKKFWGLWDILLCHWCHLWSSLWEEQLWSNQIGDTFYGRTMTDSCRSEFSAICGIYSTVALLISKTQQVASQLQRADNW